MIRKWIRFVFWPPFVVLYIVYFGGLLLGGHALAILMGLAWFISLLHPKTVELYAPALEWYDRVL